MILFHYVTTNRSNNEIVYEQNRPLTMNNFYNEKRSVYKSCNQLPPDHKLGSYPRELSHLNQAKLDYQELRMTRIITRKVLKDTSYQNAPRNNCRGITTKISHFTGIPSSKIENKVQDAPKIKKWSDYNVIVIY